MAEVLEPVRLVLGDIFKAADEEFDVSFVQLGLFNTFGDVLALKFDVCYGDVNGLLVRVSLVEETVDRETGQY